MDALYVGEYDCFGNSAIYAIVDSGTTLLSMPEEDYLRVLNVLRHYDNDQFVRFVGVNDTEIGMGWNKPCSEVAYMPPVTVSFGSNVYFEITRDTFLGQYG